MHITLHRDLYTAKSVSGRLAIDGAPECDTLEPAKPIPPGTYEVTINYSQRFKRLMPLYLNVPGYDGVRLHWGNKPTDSIGCTLVGTRTSQPDWVSSSIPAFNRIYPKLLTAFRARQRITITIS